MMHKIAIFSLLISISPGIVGQNFDPGYIVKQNGDSLYGELSLGFDEQLQHLVSFRKDKNEEAHTYTVDELTAISKKGSLFRVATFSYTEVDDQQIPMHAFVEVLLEGELSLYRFRTPRYRKVFYLQQADNPLQELVQAGVKYRTVGDKQFQVKDTRYISTLQLYMTGCPELEDDIKQSLYNANSLRKLFVAWHECRNLPFEDRSMQVSRGVRIDGIRIAYSLNPQNFDREGWINSSIVQALEVSTDIHLKGFSLFHIQVGAEVIVFQYDLDQLIYSFPVSLVKRMPLHQGELFGKIGAVPMTRFRSTNPLPISSAGSKNHVLLQAALEYEFPFPKKTPVYLEARALVFSFRVLMFGLKAGIKL
ncbi:MAG: hypothetical protein AAF587_33105 [Bacteroidota bacterium]